MCMYDRNWSSLRSHKTKRVSFDCFHNDEPTNINYKRSKVLLEVLGATSNSEFCRWAATTDFIYNWAFDACRQFQQEVLSLMRPSTIYSYVQTFVVVGKRGIIVAIQSSVLVAFRTRTLYHSLCPILSGFPESPLYGNLSRKFYCQH